MGGCVWCGGVRYVEDGTCRVCGRDLVTGWRDLAVYYGGKAALAIIRDEPDVARHYAERAAHAAGRLQQIAEVNAN